MGVPVVSLVNLRRRGSKSRSFWLHLSDPVDHNSAPFFFGVGFALVGTAAEVEGFAVGGEGGGGDSEADVLVVDS